MTTAPPTPTRPETNAPPRLSAIRTTRKVTPSTLPQARVIGGHVVQRALEHRLQDRLHLRERLVAGAPLLGLEEHELVADVARRLPGDPRHQLGRVALALGAVAVGALRGDRAAAL